MIKFGWKFKFVCYTSFFCSKEAINIARRDSLRIWIQSSDNLYFYLLFPRCRCYSAVVTLRRSNSL